MGLQGTDMCSEHITERGIHINGTNFVWDEPVIRDRTANRHDIALHGKEEKTCLLIDVATRDDSKVDTKGNENLSKYKGREIEVSMMWKVRTKTMPVITGA
jgi:hypothetical protein